MSGDKSSTSMSDVLRKVVQLAIDDKKATLLGLEKSTGVQRASIARFLAGKSSLRLDLADKLADHFGLELKKRK